MEQTCWCSRKIINTLASDEMLSHCYADISFFPVLELVYSNCDVANHAIKGR